MSPISLPKPAASLGHGSPSEILIGTGESVPSGVDGIITYNELTMNNRKWLDTIVINKIDGMADPDVRDEREVNPQHDGETAFDSFYGGRTLVLNGFIRSFNHDKLKDMEQALKTAFRVLEEKPMVFQGKSFATTSQIWCKKNAPIAWSNEYTRDDMFRRDFMITVRASDPPFISLNTIHTNKNMGVIDGFSDGPLGLGNYEFLAGAGTLKVESDMLLTTSTTNKRFGREDQIIDFLNPLIVYEYEPSAVFTSSRIGAIVKFIDANNFVNAWIDATGVPKMAITNEGVTTELTPLSFEFGSSPIARSGSTAYKVQFEMRDGKVWIKHGLKGFAPTTIAYFELEFEDHEKFGSQVRGFQYADITPGNTSWKFDNLFFGTGKVEEEEIMTVVNNGNYEASPLINIHGPITDPILSNWSTDQHLQFKTGVTIPAGDTWIIDILNGTLIDQDGKNKFSKLDPASGWPEIAPGSNSITLTGTGLGGEIQGASEVVTSVSVQHKHSWF